jgi:Uma2 family endonuclease
MLIRLCTGFMPGEGRRSAPSARPFPASFGTAPDWVCEVLSPSTKSHDRDDKLPFYARAGVTHAWLVDPAAHTLEAFVREGDGYRVLGMWRGNERVLVEPFDAAELDLARLWIA